MAWQQIPEDLHRTWLDPPSSSIEGDHDPYPLHELELARSTLISRVHRINGPDLRRKLGLKCKWGWQEWTPPPASRMLSFGNGWNGLPRAVAASQGASADPATHSRPFNPDRAGNAQNALPKTVAASEGANVDSATNSQSFNLDRSGNARNVLPKAAAASQGASAYPATHSQSFSPDRAGNSYQYLRCDSCEFQLKYSDANIGTMQQHLMDAKHYSASNYTKSSDGETYVLNPMLCRHRSVPWVHLMLVMCPHCFLVFRDIFICSMHYKHSKSHPSSLNGKYILAAPSYKGSLTLSSNLGLCLHCRSRFPYPSHLHKHWTNHPVCHPLKRKPLSDEILIFFCPYCHKTFGDDFFLGKEHVLKKHSEGYSTVNLGVKIFRRPLQTEARSLPKFGSAAGDDSIEVAMLTELKKFAEDVIVDGNITRMTAVVALKEKSKLVI